MNARKITYPIHDIHGAFILGHFIDELFRPASNHTLVFRERFRAHAPVP